MVGYKGMFKNDPVYGTERQGELTTIWSDVLVERLGLTDVRSVKPAPERMHKIGAEWAPWRSVATWYMWRSLDPIPVEY